MYALKFIPTNQITEFTPQYVFQLPRDHFQEEDENCPYIHPETVSW